MAKKKVEVVSQTKEDKVLEKESKRLRELAFSRGLLSEKKAVPEVPLRPHAGIIRCDGKDVSKKGHRKNKYLFSFPGLVAPVAGGKFGDLSQLDSKNPVLYVDFPQGRLKLFGTIVYPKNKYITLNFVRGAGNIQCEDIFESLVVFSEAWWIGTKEDNPDELRLDMPLDLQQEKHAVYDFAGGAGKPRNPKDDADVQPSQFESVQASQLESSKLSTPKAQLKMDQWLSHKKTSGNKSSESNAKAKHNNANEWDSDEDDEGFVNLGDVQTPSRQSARQSARTAGKKYSYAESSSEENETEGNDEDDDLDAEQREPESKTANNVYRKKDVDDVFLVPESQASKMDVAGPSNGNLPPDIAVTMDGNDDEGISVIDHLAASQTSAPRSAASGILLSNPIQAVSSTVGTASKQSSLSTYFSISSEKEKVTNVEPPVSVVEIGTPRTYQRTKIRKSTLDTEDIYKVDEDLTSKAEMDLAVLSTPPASTSSKRKRKATSDGKQTSKGTGRKGTSPGKRRKKTTEDTPSKEQPILVSDDSDAG